MACTCGHPGLGCECYYYRPNKPIPPKKKKEKEKEKEKEKPNMKITKKATATLRGTSVTCGEMRELIEEFDDQAILQIYYHKGYDQRDGDHVKLEVSFE